jgi:uncharacterized repeat protein (TIGR01451 family)
VTTSADLSIGKQPPEAIVPGNEATWTITVSNAGPSDAQGVVVTDTLPAGLSFVSSDPDVCTADGQDVTCQVGTVAAAGTVEIALVTLVAANVPAGTVIENAAAADSDTTDPNPGNNNSGSIPAPPAELSADLAVTKKPPAEIVPGTNVVWTITVSNAGPSDARDVVVTDTLDAALSFVSSDPGVCTADGQDVTCQVGTIAAGDDFEIALTTGVAPGVPQDSVIENAAATLSPTPDPNLDNNNPGPVPAPPARPSADLSIQKLPPEEVVPGQQAAWVVTVRNNGPSDAVDVVVTDTLPDGMSFVSGAPAGCESRDRQIVNCEMSSLPAGTSVDISLTVKVDPSLTGAAANTAAVSSATPDPDTDDNTATATAPDATPRADLSVVKTPPESIVAGQEATWTITVTNAGPSDARGVVVTDTLPESLSFISSSPDVCTATGRAVTCQVGTIAAGDNFKIALTTLVAANVPARTVIDNAASVDSDTTDPNPGNNNSGNIPGPPASPTPPSPTPTSPGPTSPAPTPPTPTQPAPEHTTPAFPPPLLPRTGSNIALLALVSAVLLFAGAATITITLARRRLARRT